MESGALEDLVRHINEKISSIRKVLELRKIAKEPEKRNILLKIGQDVFATNGLLDQLQRHVDQQLHTLKCLKELDEFFQEDLRDGQHLRDNTPAYMPRRARPTNNDLVLTQNVPAEGHPTKQNSDPSKKSPPNQIREMEFVTAQEFDGIPQYMKGRVTYEQLNTVVQSINAAVTGKYAVLHQPSRSLGPAARKLLQRFKDEETKDTKGQFFVVEADIREFTQQKVDKRFQAMLNMLRHCQRLRELRGGGLTRYLLL